jgi:flagellar hook-associated protein 2
MTLEQRPLTLLNQKEASYQAKLSAYGALKGAVSSVETAARALKSSVLFDRMSATLADGTIGSATANTAAKAATYSLKVDKLAQAQSISTNAVFTDLTADISAIDGKIKVELGTFSGGNFDPDPDKTPVTIEIDAASSSLNDIRDAINAADAGVRASVVNVGQDTNGDDQYRLIVTSLTSGAGGSLRITTLDSNDVVLDDNSGLAQFSFDPEDVAGAGNEYDVNLDAQDAEFEIDGLALTRSSNTIGDALTGVSLTLLDTGTTTLTVSEDSSGVKSAIESFVTAYNTAVTQARSLSLYNAETQQAAILTGDSGTRGLLSALRDMATQSFAAGASGFRTLSDIGVSMQRDGTLSINSSKLNSVLNGNPDEVAALFTTNESGSQGLAVRMTATLNNILSSDGLLASRTDGINRSIDDIDNRREALNRRLAQIEKRYRAQFTALDTLVSSMQQTSQFLTQQLAALSSSTKS